MRAAVLELPGGFCKDSEGNSDSQDKNKKSYQALQVGSPLLLHDPECKSSEDADDKALAMPGADVSHPCQSRPTGGILEQTKSCYEQCFRAKASRVAPHAIDARGLLGGSP